MSFVEREVKLAGRGLAKEEIQLIIVRGDNVGVGKEESSIHLFSVRVIMGST